MGGLVGGSVISAVFRYSHTQSLLFRYFSSFCGLETLSVSSSCFLFPLPNPFSSISFFCFLASSLTLVRLPSPSFLRLLFFPLSCSIIYIPLSFRYHPFLLFLYYSILSTLNTHSTPLPPVPASLPFFTSYLSFYHFPSPFFVSFLFSCISFSIFLSLPPPLSPFTRSSLLWAVYIWRNCAARVSYRARYTQIIAEQFPEEKKN